MHRDGPNPLVLRICFCFSNLDFHHTNTTRTSFPPGPPTLGTAGAWERTGGVACVQGDGCSGLDKRTDGCNIRKDRSQRRVSSCHDAPSCHDSLSSSLALVLALSSSLALFLGRLRVGSPSFVYALLIAKNASRPPPPLSLSSDCHLACPRRWIFERLFIEADPVPPTCNDSIARYGGREEMAKAEEEPLCTPAPAGVRAARGTSSPRPRVSMSTRWSTCAARIHSEAQIFSRQNEVHHCGAVGLDWPRARAPQIIPKHNFFLSARIPSIALRAQVTRWSTW
jgi:hypothetical protein